MPIPRKQLLRKHKEIDFLVLGHVTREVVEGGYLPGGTAQYSTHTASKLGWRMGLVTSLSADVDLSCILPDVDVCGVDSPATTTLRNIYHPWRREQFVEATASNIELKRIPAEWLRAPVVRTGPVVHELNPCIVSSVRGSIVEQAGQRVFPSLNDVNARREELTLRVGAR